MSSHRVSYIVQLDLPGRPIKIGSTKNPRARFQAFDCATPVACRFVGLTIDGVEREKAMLAATESAKIKGEWRYETPALLALVRRWHSAGEWFVPDVRDIDANGIAQRILAAYPKAKDFLSNGKVTPCQLGYWWATHALKAAAETDPLLIVHWAGFRPLEGEPSFVWRDSPLSIERAA
jgi:hypothetical protein